MSLYNIKKSVLGNDELKGYVDIIKRKIYNLEDNVDIQFYGKLMEQIKEKEQLGNKMKDNIEKKKLLEMHIINLKDLYITSKNIFESDVNLDDIHGPLYNIMML